MSGLSFCRRCAVLLLAVFALAALGLSEEACAADSAQGATWREPHTGMDFVWVPGGVFAPLDGPAARDPYFGDDPDRLPRVAGFWLGRFEVTQEQWRAVMGANPSLHPKGGKYPVEGVSLPDVLAFIARLNALGEARFRLPTALEWEFAARSGGGREKYSGGGKAGRVAWHKGNSGGAPHPAGTKAANGLGLHDMSGNVWEWCQDVRADGPADSPAEDLFAVARGGSWDDPPLALSALRPLLATPEQRMGTVGLRLVRLP